MCTLAIRKVLAVITAATLVGSLSSNARAAEDRLPAHCAEQGLNGPDHSVTLLDRVEKMFPNVPPAEERYFEAEHSAIFDGDFGERARVSKEARYRVLSTRPLYRIWEVRVSLQKARDAILNAKSTKGLRTYWANEHAELLHRAIGAQSAITTLQLSLKSFASNSDQPDYQLISAADHQMMAFSTHALSFSLSLYAQCRLALLMNTKR